MKRLIMLALILTAISLAFGQYIVNFEGTGETKTAYASGNVTLSGISWNMTEALIGTDAADWKNGLRATRMRGYAASAITMQVNKANGLGTLSFYYRRYGTDTQVDWKAEYSVNDGGSWIQIGSSFTATTSDTPQLFSVAVNVSGNVRIRIKRATETGSTNCRLNVDDITLTDYAGITTPTVTTVTVTDITTSSAISGGNVTSEGGASVTARGVCWNTSANPTISNYLSSNGSGSGSFVSNLTSLSASTLYYYRAYATNSQGTAYGEEYSFTTSGSSPPAVPTATTATNVGINSFTANWNPASGATSYRLDVSTSNSFGTMLTGYNNLTVNSTSQAVSGLNASTPYYYRVRAYNSNGTSGNSGTITATTLASDPFGGYYNPVAGLSGTALKNGLHDLIDNNTYANYDGAKTFLFQTLDNNDGVVRCVYTGQDYTISSSYNGSSSPNTEHTYAQSWFGTAEASIKKADVHHLFITNSSVNSSRSNLPFDVVTNVENTYTHSNGYISKRGDNSDGDACFEPADQHKGNLARALLYFNVRYNMTLSQGGVDMLETLITWHNADAVDAAELTRNTLVYGHQGNRNPFVDHPEYVASIWGGSTASTVVQFSPASAVVNEADGSVALSVQITNPSATTATTAQIALSDGSASDIGNFTTRNITFPAGSSASQSLSVTITDDSLLEGTETLIFSLQNVSGGTSAVIGNYGNFNLEITDNDIPTPVGLAATEVGFTGFTANWNAAAGITDYLFDLSTASNFSSFVNGYENYAISATSLPITGLSEGTNYYYRLRAVYNESFGEYSVPIMVTTDAIVVLDPPNAGDATAISHEGFTARWEAVSGADNYRLDVFAGSGGNTTSIIISEYVEGSSNNKYVELYNGTGMDVDLTNYKLLLFANGARSPNNTHSLSGIMPNNSCLVFKNSSAVLTLPEGVTATNSTATNFNGNDVVALVQVVGTDTTYYDIFGNIGDLSYWSSGSISATNQTLRRKTDVLSGVSVDISGSGFPTLATEWDSYPIDTADGLGSHSIGASTPLEGFQDIPVYGTAVRVNGLEPETTYTYRVRAQNSGYTSINSNVVEAVTTSVVQGIGANTCIGGAETTVLIPALTGFTNNNAAIDPVLGSSDDFSVTVSTISGGLRYTISSSNPSALNGSYILNHAGLGYSPATVLYRFNSVETNASSFTATANQTSLSISGLSGSGALEIDLLQTPPTLDMPELTISMVDGYVTLSWNEVPNATLYIIEASDMPDSGFAEIDTTSLFTWSESPVAVRFYRVTAHRD